MLSLNIILILLILLFYVKDLVLNDVYIVYLSMKCAWEYRCPQRPEVSDPLELMLGSCELPNLDTWILGLELGSLHKQFMLSSP